MRGRRVGEASNPGPAGGSGPGGALTRVVVANVTSWRGSWRGLLQAEGDVYLAQEARIPVDELNTAKAEAAARGLDLNAGAASDGSHLLACAARGRARHIRTPAMSGLATSMRHRMQYVVIDFGQRRALHMVQVYGWADGMAAAEELPSGAPAAEAWAGTFVAQGWNLLLA